MRKTSLRFGTGLVVALIVSLAMTGPTSATVGKTVKYQLAGGASSDVIPLTENIPVMVIGNQTGEPSDFGVLQMVISNVSDGLDWSGTSTANGATSGFGQTTGDFIMSLDKDGKVQLTVNFTIPKRGTRGIFGMVIKNLGTQPVSGQVTLFD